jgi:hypothetical protein
VTRSVQYQMGEFPHLLMSFVATGSVQDCEDAKYGSVSCLPNLF